MAIIFDRKKNTSKGQRASYNHIYSGFWLDKNDASLGDMFNGKSSSMVKALKLRKYQRAIANFVKILAQRDVPVVFKGTDSYTDNESVVIATDISDKNFDVYAGLALHEASHLKYTQFEVLVELQNRTDLSYHKKNEVKQILNYVEDRRIDSLVFKASPGYKAYYHKLYDHYFRNKAMGNAVQTYRQENWEHYMAQLIGTLHPKFNAKALKGLVEIVQALDINNISRLQNTRDALAVSETIYDIIDKYVTLQQETDKAQLKQPTDESQEDQQQNEEATGKGASGSDSTDDGEEAPELTSSEEREAREALRQAKNMTDGNASKAQGAKSLINKLENIQDTPIDLTLVGNKGEYNCLVHEAHKQQALLSELSDLASKYWTSGVTPEERARKNFLAQSKPAAMSSAPNDYIVPFIQQGMQLGAVIGKKLLTRREEKSIEHNRLRTGKIDCKRIAHAGYGIESVFNQINIDKYKRANIHLTIDASGSMSGPRWNNSIKLAAALGKAASMIDGLEIQISTRSTTSDSPLVTIIYDSRVNKIHFLPLVLSLIDCNGATPEGLCLEGLINKKLLVPTTNDCDSYLINICDGEPGFSSYGGTQAVTHTAKQIKRMNTELGIKHIGYFFGEASRSSYQTFQRMYGTKQSIAIPDANNAMQIAEHINRQLMSK